MAGSRHLHMADQGPEVAVLRTINQMDKGYSGHYGLSSLPYRQRAATARVRVLAGKIVDTTVIITWSEAGARFWLAAFQSDGGQCRPCRYRGGAAMAERQTPEAGTRRRVCAALPPHEQGREFRLMRKPVRNDGHD